MLVGCLKRRKRVKSKKITMWPILIAAGLVALLIPKNKKVKKKKTVFICFAMEDIKYRDYLVSQARQANSPFNFTDMSVKKEWEQKEWQRKCRTRIEKCRGFIAIISKNTHNAGGARWEMKCAKEEGIKIVGMHIFKDNKGAIPKELNGEEIIEWTWENLEKFINKL
jgi:hypothetical protein